MPLESLRPAMVAIVVAAASLLVSFAFARATPEAPPHDERWRGVRALLDDARDASSWRTTYERALQRPHDGGVWLAALIVQRCGEAERAVAQYAARVATAQVPDEQLRERHRAALRLDRLCDGFAQQAAAAPDRARELLESPAARLDPLVGLQRRYRDGVERHDTRAADAALADAVALGRSLFFERLDAGATPQGRVFDGRLYADDARRRAELFDAALFLAVCDAWNDCPDGSDYVLLRGCVEQAWCAQFRADYVPIVMASHAPQAAADAGELHALTDRIYEALRSGAVERFR